MTAIIWFVQWVHYPLFARVGADAFQAYERDHIERITWIVAPLMVIELVTAIALMFQPFQGAQPAWLLWSGLVLLAAIWASTFLVQVPLHTRLSMAMTPEAVANLVQSNWIRTIAWSLRGGLMCAVLWFSVR